MARERTTRARVSKLELARVSAFQAATFRCDDTIKAQPNWSNGDVDLRIRILQIRVLFRDLGIDKGFQKRCMAFSIHGRSGLKTQV